LRGMGGRWRRAGCRSAYAPSLRGGGGRRPGRCARGRRRGGGGRRSLRRGRFRRRPRRLPRPRAVVGDLRSILSPRAPTRVVSAGRLSGVEGRGIARSVGAFASRRN
jgi:hypothetical protein